METLNQIQNFVILAQELHFTRAASKLHLPQPVLSKEIQKLEKAVGCKLFDRSCKRNIRLTEAGKAYLRNVKSVPQRIAEAAAAARRADSGKTGELSIAISSFVYELSNASEVLKTYIAEYPDVKVKMSGINNCFRACLEVQKGDSDISVFAAPQNFVRDPELEYFPIVKTEIVLAVAADHPLAQKKAVKISELKDCPFILGNAETRDWILSDFEQKFWQVNQQGINVVQEVLGARMTYVLVAAGAGITLFARSNEKIMNEKNIVFLPLDAHFPIYIMAAWRKNNISPALKNLVNVAMKVNRTIWGEEATC